MAKNNVVDIISILNNPNDRGILTNHLDEALLLKRSIADKNQDIKTIREAATEKVGIEPKMFNSLLNLYYKGNFTEKQDELSQLESAIEMLVGPLVGEVDRKAEFHDED